MSDKIKPQHVSRKAILYVRQSSAYQVMNNLESQKLQYAMEAHLRSLGWSEVEIIDEDLGRSAGAVSRALGLSVWWRKSAWGKWVRSARVRFLALPVTAVSGNIWWRCAALSTRCSSITRRCIRRAWAMIAASGAEGDAQ